MRVVETEDNRYPYKIEDGWGGKIFCSISDLKEIKREINKILREEKAKS